MYMYVLCTCNYGNDYQSFNSLLGEYCELYELQRKRLEDHIG